MNNTQSRPYEGGDALVAALERRGVKSLFSVSGGPINSVYYATTRAEMRLVHTRHEAAAGFMADSVYRMTGTPGVLLTTLGPAVTNAVTPAATALAAGVPMLIVGGQADTNSLHKGAGMELDTMGPMIPVTKWAAQILHVDRIDEFVDEAWRRMHAGTPGPVYLEIPSNVLSAVVDPAHREPSGTNGGAVPAPEQMDLVRKALASARRPVLIAGDGIYHSGATADLRAFVKAHDLPVHTLRLARGTIDEASDPRWAGPAYTAGNEVVRSSMAEADLVILLGHNWEFDLEFGNLLGSDTKVIQVHHDQAFIGRNRPADIGVWADSGAFIRAVGELAKDKRDPEWTKGRADAWQMLQEGITEESVTSDPDDPRAHPIAVVDAVVAACPPGTRFVTSHGNVDFWADPRLSIREPGTYYRAGQSGALGAEVPYGVGTAIEDPSAATVVFVGDGGVGYHATELETAARFDAPVIVVVLDDNSWGAIAMPQVREYEVEVALALPERDWAGLAVALGGNGYKVPLEGVAGAITAALEAGGPSIVQVPIRPVLSPYMDYIS